MANYSTSFYMTLKKHIESSIAFSDTSSMDPKMIAFIAKEKYSSAAIPIPEESFELICSYFQWIQDKDMLLAFDNTINLWTYQRGNNLLEAFLQDYFQVLSDVAVDHHDDVYKQYARHFFEGKAIHYLAEKIKRSKILQVAKAHYLVESIENIRYFNLTESESAGGRYRAILDMSKPDFNLAQVTWKDTLDMHITKILPSPISVDDEDEPTLWISLLKLYMLNDPDRYEYFCKVLAYLMSPYNYNQCLIYFVGAQGKNGKSTVLKVLQDILGPHSIRMNSDLLNARPSVSFKKDDALASTEGKSLLIFNEIDERMVASTQNIKELTEGGRDEYGNKIWTSVRPAFSPSYDVNICGIPLLCANSLINFGEWTSLDSIFRRLVLVSFDYHIDVEDPTILNRLAKEYPKIQLWLYKNYFKYKGINMKAEPKPADFEKLFNAYRDDSDLMKTFFKECFDFTNMDSDKMLRSDLYRMYEVFCKVNGRQPIKNRGTNGFANLSKPYLKRCKEFQADGLYYLRGLKPSKFYEKEVSNAPHIA